MYVCMYLEPTDTFQRVLKKSPKCSVGNTNYNLQFSPACKFSVKKKKERERLSKKDAFLWVDRDQDQ